MWETLGLATKMRILSGESTVMLSLLAEDEELVRLVRAGTSKEECLKYINEAF